MIYHDEDDKTTTVLLKIIYVSKTHKQTYKHIIIHKQIYKHTNYYKRHCSDVHMADDVFFSAV